MLFDSYNLAFFIRIVSGASNIVRIRFHASNSVMRSQIGFMDESRKTLDITEKLQEIFEPFVALFKSRTRKYAV